jgi:hypothetical protein
MGLFDNNNTGSFFGNDSSGNSPPSDSSGNSFHHFGSKVDGSGGLFNISGMDASGGFKQEAKQIAIGFVQMIMYGLVAGIVVMVLFVSAQNLVWLTQKQNIANLPVNIKAPPYVKGMPPGKRDTFANRILYGYGAPYSFKDNPIALPFIPCNFPKLQTIFHIKPWMADTLTHTWVDSRKLLKVIMDGLSGLNKKIKMFCGLFIMSALLLLTPLISLIFTYVGSFRANVGWSILGTIFGVIPLLVVCVSMAQVTAMMWYLFLSPIVSRPGRAFIIDQVYKHKKHLRLLYMLIIICMSPMYLPPLITVGMIVGIILFGY